MQSQFLMRLQEPATMISIIVFVFSLWGVWATLNNRIKDLETKMKEINVVDIKTEIAEMRSDISWIKSNMERLLNLK